jgi:flotillin
MNLAAIAIAISAGIGLVFTIWLIHAILTLRTVVSTNDVHIVQSGKKTVSYGKDQLAGNVYYSWPDWMPIIGVKTIHLPMHVFDVKLDGYAAYDKGRVPFTVDVMAFFRIEDSNVAAQRVHTFDELRKQLIGVLQGACRTILASNEIEEILEGRSKFGDAFTKEVDHNLKAWGVQTVKMIELMDIRDADGSKVIENIMAKKKSLIERESRIQVAENQRAAQEAEIVAAREVAIRKQEADQQVGQRAAEKDKQIGVSNEQAKQEVKAQEKITTERSMEVKRVQDVKQAEIARDVQLVAAEQEKKTSVIKAEGVKQTQIVHAEGQREQTVLIAQGDLQKAKLHAEGIKAEGEAEGAAETARLMAPVNSQITLAKEIGNNDGYQQYLVTIRGIEKEQVVGVEQAQALKAANVKVIANSGDPVSGVSNVMDLFSTKGGTALAGALEALIQSETGAAVVKRLTSGAKAAA